MQQYIDDLHDRMDQVSKNQANQKASVLSLKHTITFPEPELDNFLMTSLEMFLQTENANDHVDLK